MIFSLNKQLKFKRQMKWWMSCVCVQVSSLLWMRRERRGVVPLRPLCLWNMATGAKLRGKKRISLSVTVVLLRAQHWYLMTPSSVLVKAVCVCVLCWSPAQRERADSPGPSCVSLKSDRSMDHPSNFRDGNQSIEKRWGFIRYYTTISIRHPLILVLVFLEESRRRERTPLDPAVSPWRATTLCIILLNLKIDAPPERKGKDLSKIIKRQHRSNIHKS